MKMNSAQIKQTLHQIDAQAIPAGDPAMPQLERLFGGHTFFLDSEGLSIVEPAAGRWGAAPAGGSRLRALPGKWRSFRAGRVSNALGRRENHILTPKMEF